MIQLSYSFKCDASGCPIESKENLGDLRHTMSIPELPLPRGWHYLDHKIICAAHSVVVDKKWIDEPQKITGIVTTEISESSGEFDIYNMGDGKKKAIIPKRRKK